MGNLINLNEHVEHNLTEEQKLWKAVLSQAVYESCTNFYQGLPLTQTEKKASRKWIDLDNPDFNDVCEKAGYNAIYIYQQALKLMKKGEVTRTHKGALTKVSNVIPILGTIHI
tara:strand:+ start:271 stop:609 length:339 start_codon:yes stop_codon:yes gene_type:complete